MNKSESGFSVNKAEDSTGFLLWQVTNLWQRSIRKALAPLDLTHSQFVILASTHWLQLQQKEVTQVLLSEHTHIDPMTTSTVLRTLQSKSLILRQEHATDTRAKTVVLTSTGIKLVKQAVKIVEGFDKSFFGRLDTKVPALNKLLQSLLLPGETE